MKKLNKLALAASTGVSSFLLTASPVLAQLGTVEVPERGFANSLGGLISGLLNFVMVVAALLVFVYLIWGGIEWITSGGDKGKMENARNKITAAVIGLIVLAASYAILQLALTFLGFEGGLKGIFEQGITPINQYD